MYFCLLLEKVTWVWRVLNGSEIVPNIDMQLPRRSLEHLDYTLVLVPHAESACRREPEVFLRSEYRVLHGPCRGVLAI